MAIETYEDGLAALARLTQWARIIVWIFVGAWGALSLLVAWGAYSGTNLEEVGGAIGTIYGVIALAAALSMFISFVIVGMWIYRAHANLRLAGGYGLEFTPGWAVGWFFIPIANLFKPLQAMRSLWAESHGMTDRFGDTAGGPLPQWWGCWIVANMLSNITSRSNAMTGGGGSGIGIALDLIGNAVMIAAAVLLLRIIDGVADAQRSTLGVAETFA